MATKKVAKINLYDKSAHIEFNFRTSSELKERLKKCSWLKWKKSDVNGKTYWYLDCDLAQNEEEKVAELETILKEFEIEPIIRTQGDDEFSEKFENDSERKKEEAQTDRAQPFRLYMKPSLYQLLSTVAEEKHMSFSQFIICATDFYIKNNNVKLPLKTVGSSLFECEPTTSEQIRMAMAKERTKPAWVADHLGYTRSSFYSKLEKNIWTKDEIEELSDLLNTKIT